MNTFRCGHPKSPENSVSNGTKLKPVCKQCKSANAKRRYIENPDRSKENSKLRMRKYRGGLKGHHNGRKVVCSYGHKLSPENTYLYGDWRQCKECRRRRTREYWHDKRSNGGSHTEEEWQALCEYFNHLCLRCGRQKPLTRDHIIPVSKGGSNDVANLQPLCQPCNSSKKDRILDYRRILADFIEGCDSN